MAGDWIKTGLVQLTLWRNPNHFEPYWKWEDYHAGMYRDSQEDLEEKIQSAVSVLGSDLKCKESGRGSVVRRAALLTDAAKVPLARLGGCYRKPRGIARTPLPIV
jgi:hypothetical protein